MSRHYTIDSWVAAFELWSGLKVGAIDHHPRSQSCRVSVASPTGVVIAELTVSRGDDGWNFGGTSPAFQADWVRLCRGRF